MYQHHQPSHRAEGRVGSFTVHSPSDYVPRHAAEVTFVPMAPAAVAL